MRDCVICSHCSHLQSVCLWQRGYREVLSMRESCTGDSQYYSVRWQSWCLWDFFRRILIWQHRVSFFFLCHAGADIPESRRIFLREHNVHGNCGVGRQRFHCISGKKDRNRSDRHFTILESFYSLRLVRESEEICL